MNEKYLSKNSYVILIFKRGKIYAHNSKSNSSKSQKWPFESQKTKLKNHKTVLLKKQIFEKHTYPQ